MLVKNLKIAMNAPDTDNFWIRYIHHTLVHDHKGEMINEAVGLLQHLITSNEIPEELSLPAIDRRITILLNLRRQDLASLWKEPFRRRTVEQVMQVLEDHLPLNRPIGARNPEFRDCREALKDVDDMDVMDAMHLIRSLPLEAKESEQLTLKYFIISLIALFQPTNEEIQLTSFDQCLQEGDDERTGYDVLASLERSRIDPDDLDPNRATTCTVDYLPGFSLKMRVNPHQLISMRNSTLIAAIKINPKGLI